MKPEDKIIEGMTELLEGFVELHTKIESDFDASAVDFEDETNADLRIEIDAAIVTEMRATLESVMDTEDYTSEQIATFLTVMQDALEEIDPDVFEQEEDELAISEEEEEFEDDDLEDFDDDDLEYDDEEDDDEDDDDDDEY
jgi:hypothetical protein